MSQDKLSSWKEIAIYLKCDESTARRWERKNRLPVHRVGNKGGSVYAFPQEIDAWMRGSGRKELETRAEHKDMTAMVGGLETNEPLHDRSITVDLVSTVTSAIKDPLQPPGQEAVRLRVPSSWRRYLLSGITVMVIGTLSLLKALNVSGGHHLAARLAHAADSSESGSSVLPGPVGQNSGRTATYTADDFGRSDESTLSYLKAFVKESQIWETLTLYSEPWKCDANELERYWLRGSKAYVDVGESASRLNELGSHYGFGARLLNFEFRYVTLSRDGLSANIGTREHWWLPLYTNDEALASTRNPDEGPYEIDYLLVKVNGRWYLKSTSTPYSRWKPQQITCKNWPRNTAKVEK